ncbi:MAG TPA: hypothetical protein VF540_01600 [Segetibacter sp.]|jgi:hypothetical protein
MQQLSTPFNSHFFNVDNDDIVRDVKSKGYYTCEDALEKGSVEELLGKINFDKVLINENDAGVVTANNSKYLTHCLACSEEVYNIVTSEKVLEICDKYFTKKFRLTNHRVYQTNKQNHMPWHTDNNRQTGAVFNGKHNLRGLLFMFYLSDVTKNAFQYIQSSEKISSKYSDEIYLTNKYISDTYSKDIVTLKMKKGTFILCDTHGLHRAEPFNDAAYSRTTLLFQVDEVGDEDEGHGEKNIINTAYLNNVTPLLAEYLGFGYNRSYPAFPNSSLDTLPISTISKIQKQIISSTCIAAYKGLVKLLLPGDALVKAKQLRWKSKLKK